jgi:hypothetical protein
LLLFGQARKRLGGAGLDLDATAQGSKPKLFLDLLPRHRRLVLRRADGVKVQLVLMLFQQFKVFGRRG